MLFFARPGEGRLTNAARRRVLGAGPGGGGEVGVVDVAEQLAILTSGVEAVLPEGALAERLATRAAQGRPLRVKLGIDPSSPDLHLGHAVVLNKLRAFQELGHTAVLIIGDFTGMIGDPTGRSETRRALTREDVEENALTYLKQARKILLPEPLELRRNSEWLAAMSMDDVIGLTAGVTVAQMLERDDFAKRFALARPISLVEFLYPLFQAMDSVAVRADVELGGTDQTFNLLMGREVQRARGQDAQVVVTVPLLEGLDGVQKMSKSLGNHIGIEEPADVQYGKAMHIPDSLVGRYLRLATSLRPEEIVELEAATVRGGPDAVAAKRRLALEIVVRYHGGVAAADAEAVFNASVQARQGAETLGEKVPVAKIPAGLFEESGVWIVRLLVELGKVRSGGEARRLVSQGAVRLGGSVVIDWERRFKPEELDGALFQVGRRGVVRLSCEGGLGGS